MSSMCLGEKRRLAIPLAALQASYAKVLPNVVEKETNWLDVEVVGLNKMTFAK